MVFKGFSLPKQGETLKEPVATPTPSPLPLAPGKQVYYIRSDEKTSGPLVSEVSFDPLDVGKGETIVVSVKAKDAVTVNVTMIEDNGLTPHELILSSGNWSSSWKAESPHNRIYGATIVAKDTKGTERKVELWFR